MEGVKFDKTKSGKTLEEFISNPSFGALFLILISDEPVGYFCLTSSYTLENYGKDCFLDEIYIKPDHRKLGVGSEIIKYIENYLKNRDFKAIHLIVYDSNQEAHKFYLRNGFHDHSASFMTKLLKKD
ncbi:GNAT family N-acetyltransferase [candidate division WOR-3 bacterium]|nr:GNAT family N-acetyltransferase [candidate division WOR-3 bacterium]